MAREIYVDTKKCTGCMICQQLCASTFTNVYNTANARITVMPKYQDYPFEVSLKPECTRCGICVIYCKYGALLFEG